jgi:hypothetical protein
MRCVACCHVEIFTVIFQVSQAHFCFLLTNLSDLFLVMDELKAFLVRPAISAVSCHFVFQSVRKVHHSK